MHTNLILFRLFLVLVLLNTSCKPNTDNAKLRQNKLDISALTEDAFLDYINTESTTVFFLVRHAEKADDGTKDPPLTEEGRARARDLKNLLADIKLDEIYSSNYKRTIHTATPIASDKKIKLYDPRSLEEFSKELLGLETGHKTLIVGHSNSTPTLVNLLQEQKDFEQLSEKVYNKLFVVYALGSDSFGVRQMEYGK